MVRTQIYLTDEQKQRLQQLATTTGKRQSDLIREALDGYLERHQPRDWFEALQPMVGMWADRPEMDDYARRLREEVEERLAERWRCRDS